MNSEITAFFHSEQEIAGTINSRWRQSYSKVDSKLYRWFSFSEERNSNCIPGVEEDLAPCYFTVLLGLFAVLLLSFIVILISKIGLFSRHVVGDSI